jgi:serine/threonine protein kinase
MEYCDLGDLASFIKRNRHQNSLGGLQPRLIHHFLRHLSSAVEYLRSKRLIHRDLKPQNILLSSSLHAVDGDQSMPIIKLADFGFARVLHAQTMAETLCGSPLYMAPEILRYELYDGKADLWSIGVILFEMIVGRPPFKAPNQMALLRKIQTTKYLLFPDELSGGIGSDPEFEKENTREQVSALQTGSSYKYPQVSGLNPSSSNSSNDKNFTISQELRDLTRMLLKRDPMERITFEEFFLHPACGRNAAFLRNYEAPTAAEQGSFPPRSVLIQRPQSLPSPTSVVADVASTCTSSPFYHSFQADSIIETPQTTSAASSGMILQQPFMMDEEMEPQSSPRPSSSTRERHKDNRALPQLRRTSDLSGFSFTHIKVKAPQTPFAVSIGSHQLQLTKTTNTTQQQQQQQQQQPEAGIIAIRSYDVSSYWTVYDLINKGLGGMAWLLDGATRIAGRTITSTTTTKTTTSPAGSGTNGHIHDEVDIIIKNGGVDGEDYVWVD